VDFLLANAIVFYMHCAIKKNLAVFNLVDFLNSPNHQNKFYAKFSSYTVHWVYDVMKPNSTSSHVLTHELNAMYKYVL